MALVPNKSTKCLRSPPNTCACWIREGAQCSGFNTRTWPVFGQCSYSSGMVVYCKGNQNYYRIENAQVIRPSAVCKRVTSFSNIPYAGWLAFIPPVLFASDEMINNGTDER